MRRVLLLAIFLLLLIPPVFAQVSQADVATIEAAENADGSVTVTITGTLPNSCVDVEEVTYEVADGTITVTVGTSRPDPNVMCAQALVDFSTEVTIPASDLDSGEYTVQSGRFARTTFTYEASAETDAPTEPEAEVTEESDDFSIQIPESCVLPTAEQALFVDEESGFCFTYPLTFDLTEDENSVVALTQEGRDGEPDVNFTLEILTSSREVSQQLQADLDAALLDETGNLAVERMTIGGRPAIQVDVLRDELSARRVYIITADGFAVLTLTPAASIAENVAIFWDNISETFAFFDVAGDTE